ncbi:hypothetical protein AB0J81_14780 [Streptomyces bobili]|uniref:hypothetical protein n=1 Tax=Streptomyces bobili TaxID=67280 RepID=UPI00341E45B0
MSVPRTRTFAARSPVPRTAANGPATGTGTGTGTGDHIGVGDHLDARHIKHSLSHTSTP